MYSFLTGKGFIRAVSIDSAGAVFQVYSKDLTPVFLTPASNEREAAGLQSRTTFRLSKGQSKMLSFGYTGNPLLDNFQVVLDDIITPENNAEFEFTYNGVNLRRKVNILQRITPNSDWILDSISISEPTKTTLAKYKLPKLVIEAFDKLFGNELDLHEVEYKAVLRNSLGETKVLRRKGLVQLDKDKLQKKVSLPVPDLNDEDAKILEQQYCDYDAGQVYKSKSDDLACEAVARYRTIVDKYQNSKEAKLAYNDLAELYKVPLIDCNKHTDFYSCYVDMQTLAKYYYRKAGVDKSLDLDLLPADANSQTFLDELGIGMTLIRSEKITEQNKGRFSARIFDSEGTTRDVEGLTVNSNISRQGSNEPIKVSYRNKEYGWVVDRVNTNSVSLKLQDLKDKNEKVRTLNLKLNEITKLPIRYEQDLQSRLDEPIDFIEIQVTNIATNTEAYVTILPGSTTGYTESSFTLNVPIDPRPFKWTPEMLNSHINATQSVIDALDSMIEKLDDLVSTWKKVCLGTFAVLALKSSLLQSPVRAQSRRLVSESFKERCNVELFEKGVSTRPDFDTPEECLNHYSTEIGSATDATEEAFKEANEKLKGNIDTINENIQDPGNLCGTFGEYKAAGETLGKSNTEILKNYRDCYSYSKVLSETDKTDPYYKFVENKINAVDVNTDIKLRQQAESFLKLDGLDKDQKKQLIASAMDQLREQKEKVQADDSIRVVIKQKNEDNVDKVSIDATAAIPKESDKTQLQQIDVIGIDQYTYKKDYLCKKDNTDDCKTLTSDSEKTRIEKLKKRYALDNLGRQVYVEKNSIDSSGNLKENTKLYYSSITIDVAGQTTAGDYYGNSLEAFYKDDGSVICYPTGKGTYAKVLDRHPSTGSIRFIEQWNVGPNRRIECGLGDDVRVLTDSELETEKKDIKSKLLKMETKQCTNFEGKQQVGPAVDGKQVKCKKFNLSGLTSAINPQCTDVMEPEDCKILFNACDPVMCPSSRCTLGGRVPPRNVIQSGIIGSTVLCFPNIQQGIAVPICLTGIDAGLKNIRSLAQSYKDCLEIKLKNNEDVGFCDYIRSVGICELVWREGAELADISGGVIDWATGNLFDDPDGGGEYLKFQSTFQNLGDSVNFFTSEYKETYAAHFLSQSTDEIGTQLCRLSVNGKIPYPGKILDFLTEPEDPPQFTAFFDEAPYAAPGEVAATVPRTTFTTTELSLYKVFYHLYAGTGYYQGAYSQPTSVLGPKPEGIQQPILYSVYLVNREMGLPPLYVTFKDDEAFFGFQGTVEPGKYSQKTVQKLGTKGYNQICVNINGQESCGFGKISSSFGLQELNDVITKNEASRITINSSEECVTGLADSSSASLARLSAVGAASAAGGVGIQTSAQLTQLGGTATANLLQGASPLIGLATSGLDRSLLSTGVTRICSFAPPTADGRWETVGSCGADANGKSLGTCYLDKSSVSINDVDIKNDLYKELKARGELKDVQFLDPEESKGILTALNVRRDELIDNIIVAAETNRRLGYLKDAKLELANIQSDQTDQTGSDKIEYKPKYKDFEIFGETIKGKLTLTKPGSLNGFNFRAEPGLNTQILGLIRISQEEKFVTKVYETKEVDGETWARIYSDNATTGWVVIGANSKYEAN